MERPVKSAHERPVHIGLFEGEHPLAAVLHAGEHPSADVRAVDLKKMSVPGQKPPNLTLLHSTDALKYVRSLPDNSVDHFWSNFPSMAFDDRMLLLQHIARSLKPGSKYRLVVNAYGGANLTSELKKHGLKVTMAPATLAEILQLRSDTGDRQAKVLSGIQKNLKEFEKLPPSVRQDYLNHLITINRTALRDLSSEVDGKRPSKGAKRALKMMLDDIPLWFTGTPFRIIDAEKPLKSERR